MGHISPPRLDKRLEISGDIGFRLQKALHDIGHPLQGGERDHHDALGRHRPIEHFGVATRGRLFVAPDHIFAGPLE